MADEFLKEYDEAAKGFAKLEVRASARNGRAHTRAGEPHQVRLDQRRDAQTGAGCG